MLKIAVIMVVVVLLPLTAGAKCRVWPVPEMVCPNGVAPMCIKDGRNITCDPHAPEDCAPITENVTCESEQEFKDFQAAHPSMKLNPGR